MVSMSTKAIDKAHVFAGDEPCNGEERYRAPARFYALQTPINWASSITDLPPSVRAHRAIRGLQPV